MNAMPKSRAILAVLLSATLVAAAPPLRVNADEAIEPTVGEAATIEEALPGEGDLGSGPEVAPLPEKEPAQDPEQADPAREEATQDPEGQPATEGQVPTDEPLPSQGQAPEPDPDAVPTSDPSSEPLTSSGNPDAYLTATGDIPGWDRADESFTVGDITYTFARAYNDANEQVCRLFASKYNGSASSITIPDVVNGYKVHGIHSDGDGSWQVANITVSKGIKQIVAHAFQRCTELQTITFASGSELSLIGVGAFAGCSSLKSFTMPPKLERIQASPHWALTFAGCDALTDIYFNDKVCPFQNEYYPVDGPTAYDGYYNICPDLSQVRYHVPASSEHFKTVDGVLFSKDGSVLYSRPGGLPGSSYVVPSGVREIASYAFYGTELPTEVSFPNTLERIDELAFSHSSLTSVTIPNSVSYLGESAFLGSQRLKSVRLGTGMKDLSAEESQGQFYDCMALTDLTLPEGIEVISNTCFARTGLSSLHIPSTVKQINYGGFGECESLSKVTGGEGLERIYRYAFLRSALSSFPFGDKLVFVAGAAFQDSEAFNNVYPSYMTNDTDYDEDGINDYAVADAVYDDVLYLSGTFEYDMANEVLALVNQERAAEGLSPLTIDSKLTEGAMQRAAECAMYFYHERPTGRSCYSVTPAAYAENIAAGYGTPSAVMRNWMDSSVHRSNILSDTSNSIGIGCYRNGSILYWVQLFGMSDGDGVSQEGSVPVTPRVDLDYDTHNLEGFCFNYDRPWDPESLDLGATFQIVGWVPNPGWKGTLAKIDAKSFTWKSSNPSVASVSQDGLVTVGTKAGKATITATTHGGYTLTKNFEVKVPIATTSIGAIKDQAYTGAALTPKPTIKMGSTTLKDNTDYTLSYANNVEAGIATVTVTGKGSYSGTTNVTFKILGADISKASAAAIQDRTYRGAAYLLKPTLMMGSTKLRQDIDYMLSYKDNVNVGTATIIVKGKGNYSGTKNVNFKIVPADISGTSISTIRTQTYTGAALTPKPAVRFELTTLEEGTDYTLSYSGNVNAGTATVTITGKGNFAGTASTTFTIMPASIALANVGAIQDRTYTGSAIKPQPTVKMGSATLVEGTDYTLSYKDNVNAGTATVTVTGKGNYTGSKDVTFKISKASISQASVSAIADQTHTGAAIKPKPTVRMGSATLREGVDYTLSYKDNVNVGTATVTVTGTGGYAGSASRSFRVVAARVPMHRLYNPNTGEHFYTSDAAERDNLVRVGWSYEGVGWTAPSQSGTPVYRLYNSVVRGGDHHYTMDRAEYEHLGEVGWTQEGVGWYSDDARGVPIYREYNPNAMTGTHNYTASLEEHRHLVSLGWHDEGIGWYGLK